MECVLDRVVPLEDRDAHRFVIGRVVTFQVEARMLRGDRIDAYAYRPVGRIGGPLYAMPGEIRHASPSRAVRQ
jgi:flavin reductase (DIM6/NTAB) family NADH-FMN oxidoreductase RutF